ncbi:MAG: hypothetical protein ACI31I_04710 [Bacilli bacterium]
MRILWVSNDGTGVVVLIIIIVIFVLIFAALFMLNLFSAKIRLTFYVDGQDVKKYYVKVNQNIEVPEELNMFTWYEDEECTIKFTPHKMKFKEVNLYTKSTGNN